MRPSERYTILGLGVAAAVAGAAGFLVLDQWLSPSRLGPKPPGVTLATAPDGLFAVDATVRLERFTFVPRPPTADAGRSQGEVLAAIDPPAEDPRPSSGPWHVELKHSSPPPQQLAPPLPPRMSLAPERFPWATPRPDGRRRLYTLKQRLAVIAPAAGLRLAQRFEKSSVAWPPTEVGLVAIKDERVLELHARRGEGPWKLVHRYPVLAASGGAGPKLRQGDKQVPEGIYAISFLNPNSLYHVSLRVSYPNAFDKRMAARDGRVNLGGDIMIHGKDVSVGCLAVGDDAAEELFLLAAQTGLPNVKLVIAPSDFRRGGVPAPEEGQPAWLPALYQEVANAMTEFKPPPRTGLMSLFGK